MQGTKTVFYVGKKAVNLNDPTAWTVIAGDVKRDELDHLYSLVSWLYRCVSLRGYSVTSMPFEIRKGDSVVYEFDGTTTDDNTPNDMPWLGDLPHQLGQVEVAAVLGGRAYLQKVASVMDTIMELRWLVPWSVEPEYNKQTGELLYFERSFGAAVRPPERLKIEEVIRFWLPDYAVENGPAINYPGRAVLQNAGVIKGLDLFLKGYFDRGMIKAALLKYQQTLSPDEAKRVKEWWRRVFQGVRNAFTTEVVRGDFDVMTIGEGIKDLRDNVLTKDEKDAIAVGLGIPPSKLLPVGVNRATKDGDDRGYIEDTILPEIGWIYRACNKQIFNPMGYSIVARPEQLRVMQADEVERSSAALNYHTIGYAPKEIESILGIHVPDEIKEEVRKEQEEILSSAGGAGEKTLLNGIQIESALSIINTFGQGTITRENAINMYDAFLGINPEVAKQLIPEAVSNPIQTDVQGVAQRQGVENAEMQQPPAPPVRPARSFDYIELLDKRDERDQFIRWLKNRNYTAVRVDDFGTVALTRAEKMRIATEGAKRNRKVTEMDRRMDEYGDQLAQYIEENLDLTEQEFKQGLEAEVRSGLLSVFKDAAGIDENEGLTPPEQAAFNELLSEQLDALPGYVEAIYANKGAIFNELRDRLQEIGANLGGRLQMWKNAARKFWNRGIVMGRRTGSATWRIGATEESCEDCLFYNGQTKTREEWASLAGVLIYPQSRALSCKGYNCDCSLEWEN